MSALIRSNAPAEKAELLLKEMLESEPGLIQLDAGAFSMIIKAYGKLAGDTSASNAARKTAAKQAEDIYWSMVDYLRDESSLDLVPPSIHALMHGQVCAREATPRKEGYYCEVAR
jgi:hypothetical protein